VTTNESGAPVLIAYDGSEFAKAAIADAGSQLVPGSSAIVLTVSEPLESIPFLGAAGVPLDSTSVEGILDAAKAGADKVAEEGAQLAREAGFEAEPLVETGGPTWNRIVEVADQRDARLIVIGSRGRSGLSYAVLGSVAAAVAQHSKRSVLIVHRRY
jgi:nucleotide-binding universal stress UspA family protein